MKTKSLKEQINNLEKQNTQDKKIIQDKVKKAEFSEDQLKVALKQEIGQGLAEVQREKDRVVVTVGSAGAFSSGSARLTKQARAIMQKIAKVSGKGAGQVNVSGHTDNVPLIFGGQYRDNWDLAAARASSVVQELAKANTIPPEKLQAISFGETKPIEQNDTRDGREKIDELKSKLNINKINEIFELHMEFENNINNNEGYSPEAIANFEVAVEEFAESLLAIKAEHANIAVFRSLQIIMNGRKRRIADLGNVDSPGDPMKIELMIYNKEHLQEVLDFIRESGFPAKNEEGSQFIHIRVPKPSRMQLEEIGDDIIRRTNSVSTRLAKMKTNTGLRIRAAMEKEFIDQRIATIATKRINDNLDRCTQEVRIIGIMKKKYTW